MFMVVYGSFVVLTHADTFFTSAHTTLNLCTRIGRDQTMQSKSKLLQGGLPTRTQYGSESGYCTAVAKG